MEEVVEKALNSLRNGWKVAEQVISIETVYLAELFNLSHAECSVSAGCGKQQ